MLKLEIIEFDKKYEFFFLEDFETKIYHPVSDFKYELKDLSVNLLINLKWIKWGYAFFSQLYFNLNKLEEEIDLKELITDSIHKSIKIEKKEKVLLLDDVELKTNQDFENCLQNYYLNRNFKNLFNENTEVHFKLKLNLNEYLALTNILNPTFVKFSK